MHASTNLRQLQDQLDVLLDLCDTLSAHLEREREAAQRQGDNRRVNGLQQGLLQVARVRNDVRTACHDIQSIGAGPSEANQPAAA